ncbi:hypothetical protein ACQJBY_058280 [Aegilops geniculata]
MADIAYNVVELQRVARVRPQACMFDTYSAEQSEIVTTNRSADATIDTYRDAMKMSYDDKFAVLRSMGEECIYEDELRLLLKKKAAPVCYVWFEPSPMMDIEQGIMKTVYVNKMLKAGCTVKILMADWFLQRHHMIGTDLKKIRTIGCYNIEMWKAAGMDLDRVELVWLSDELNHHAVDYWPLAVEISRKYTMKSMARFCWNKAPYGPQRLPAAEIFYPCMQVAAILCQKADMWLFSVDHRDITMLARDYCEDINRETKPAIMLHNMLPILLENPEFQDLRDPDRTIFMHDNEEDLNRKILWSFCPPKIATCNPCLEYIKYVIFPWFGKLAIVRKEGNGYNRTYTNMEQLLVDYESGDIDSTDVKLAFEKAMNKILEPVRNHFRGNTEAQDLFIGRKLQKQITADTWKIILQNEEVKAPW